ncbi:flagellar hook protein FlgE [Mariprofundus ferrinatatus]|uniref:Flagellar hook protein FlgE n=1 Tax=Mariprofundus ferrinatatus TaxID=1921087 RepID=A0A2K8L9G8_9PROT|nr:flagellar hook protein FlgE [Mariprofundus ferrinatatus]ATX82899.1 flagellar hook protein FlgE [Mariprofundus ferrinatatus]
MGIYNALFTGASGLTAFGEGVRVIGDNIANVNTLGFKSQNVNFADVLGQTVNVSRSNIANQVGNGVRIGAITRDQAQGSVQSTTSATDMAINGSGMFVLKDPASGQTQYSRAGAFIIDSDMNLINGQGFRVQGWALDAAGNPQGNVTNITAANVSANASPTTKVDVGVNLDATAGSIAPAAFDPTNPGTYNSKADVAVYDSLGSLHNLSLYFVKTGVEAVTGNAVWDWHVTVDGGDVTGGTAGVPFELGGGAGSISTITAGPPATSAPGTQSLVFDPANGAMVNEFAPAITAAWKSAAAGNIALNFGSATTVDASGFTGTGLDGALQLAGQSATRFMNADGYAAGFLDHMETDSTGRINGIFTNGERRPLFQVALAKFPNEAVLSKLGNNMMGATIASGKPVLEKPGNGGMGSISPFALEQSNVDLGNEFVKLIVIQRGYEANSKTILTTDQMLSSLMTLKR